MMYTSGLVPAKCFHSYQFVPGPGDPNLTLGKKISLLYKMRLLYSGGYLPHEMFERNPRSIWAKMDNMPSGKEPQKRPTPSMSLSFFCRFPDLSVVWTHEAQSTKRARHGAASWSCPCATHLLPYIPKCVSTHRSAPREALPQPTPSTSDYRHFEGKPVSTIETCLSLFVLAMTDITD